MSSSKRSFYVWIPISLLIINLLLFSFLIEELIDASAPNYGGGLGLLTPLAGLISFFYIRRIEGEKPTYLWILQAMNWVFMIVPVTAILISMAAFI